MKIINRKTALASAVALAFGLSTAALANPVTDTFDVTATVAESCTIESTQDVAFPTFDPFTGGSASGDLEVMCTNGTGYDIALVSTGFLDHATEVGQLGYGLFQDSGHSSAWGNDENQVSDTGNGTAQLHTVYVDIPADAEVPVGVYSETVTVSVNW